LKNTPNPSASGIAADVSGGKNLKKEESAKEKIVNSKDIAETVVKWVKQMQRIHTDRWKPGNWSI
jgi:hypothetical protein